MLSPDPALGDALSTALFSMTEEDGQALIASLADTEAVWLFADGRTVVSNGFESVSEGGLS